MAMSCCTISDLPDEILGKVLSLLLTKVAASTSVLSKRWRNLLGLVLDNLCFDESMVVYPNEEEEISGSFRFCEFVEKTLALLSKSPIKRISVFQVPQCRRDYAYQRWIWTAMERRDLLELHLHACPNSSGIVGIQRDLLTSNTLVKLTLSGAYDVELKRVFLPVLKSLSLLELDLLGYDEYCGLIDGCPVLEELFIRDADHFYPPCCGAHVDSASIKRLVVFVHLPDSQDHHDVAYIRAPSLVYLDYSSYVSENCQFVDLDSLVEARLCLRLWDSTNHYDDDDDDSSDDDDYYSDDEPFGDVTNLVAGITNITTLHLSPDSLEAFHFCCKSMPVFNNLLHLSVESDKDKGWQAMPLLLNSCPNLHSLLIKGLVHRVTNRCGDACPCILMRRRKNKKRKIVNKDHVVSCLWTCQVKLLEISDYGASFQELKQMRHFLGKLGCLETVKVGLDAENNDSGFLRPNLLALPRLSSKCNIQFI